MTVLARLYPMPASRDPRPRRDATLPDPTTARPLRASDYLKLRREAAGFTHAELARKLVDLSRLDDPQPHRRLSLDEGRRRHREALCIVRLLERPGSISRHAKMLKMLASIMRFDPHVYMALALDKPANHPRICRGCGCSDGCQCADRNDDACGWAAPGLCTHCVARGVLIAEQAA